MTLAIAIVGGDELAAARLQAGARRLTGLEIEVVRVVPSTPPARARNLALATATAELLVFLDDDDPLESSFLDHACRLLRRRPAAAFVTSFGDEVPLRDDPAARPCDPLALLARSWFVHAPAVLRRNAALAAGGFDETLAACEDPDLLIRLLASGAEGWIAAEAGLRSRAWGGGLAWDSDGAPAAARQFYDRHHALADARWNELLLAQERIARQLFAVRAGPSDRAAVLDRERARLRRELAEVNARLAHLRGEPRRP